ncbi:uncharacterized protein LOC111636028 [Centruroides sculpturatus]|uniref:uncharacterized protein LOC111636028 n=1 Tax=Centruroides sculpturatus TaxID=218467 RepID=UPI000C6D4A05|nr:uncharacterized protein LOC111636028 [Centruroides sculpturatus]
MLQQMKTKSFVGLLACIIATSIIVCLYGDPKPSIHEIVTETHRQLSQLKKLKVVAPVQKDPVPEERYLKSLGFTDNPRLFPTNVWNNVSLPVFVTAVASGDSELTIEFIKSHQHCFPNHVLLIYDIGLDTEEFLLVIDFYNSLITCSFYWLIFFMQEVLDQAGAVIWMDVNFKIISSQIDGVLQKAQKEGLVSWSIDQPTSTLTHPKMFDYFQTRQDNFYFHRMVEPSHILLYNTGLIHQHLMLPWVQCALTPDCIAPIGAQSSGCRFDKKPLYRYSGCHRYDMSALNVILGIMFDYTNCYVASNEDKFFQKVEERLENENMQKDNTTSMVHEVVQMKNA